MNKSNNSDKEVIKSFTNNKKENKDENKIEFKIYYFSKEEYYKMNNLERKNKIINSLKGGNLIIIDSILKPNDELEIIKEVISSIDLSFKGIEISTLRKKENNFLKKIFVGEKGLTIIGPSNLIKRFEREGEDLLKLKL